MLRTNIYLTEEQAQEIKARAVSTRKPKAEVLREVIDKGLQSTPVVKSASTQAFMKLAKIAEEFKGKGIAPHDLSVEHDKYTWDE